MDCLGADGEYLWQNVYNKKTGLSMKYLNVTTGEYIGRFINSELVNGCDISPFTDLAYCQGRKDGASYLARFGPSKTRWVAKLPCQSFSGTFGSIQNTFYFGCDRNLYALPAVDSLTGYEDFESLPEDQDFSSMPAILPAFDPMADNIGDFTAMIGDLDGEGLADHVIGLFETTGYIIKVTDAALAPTSPKLYKVELTGVGDVHFGVFGAGFHFRNHIFFASNQKGVVMLDKESIDVVNGTATVHYVGDSASLSGNDGMSCHNRMPGFMKGSLVDKGYGFEPVPVPTPAPPKSGKAGKSGKSGKSGKTGKTGKTTTGKSGKSGKSTETAA
jgi:hypothetical protein